MTSMPVPEKSLEPSRSVVPSPSVSTLAHPQSANELDKFRIEGWLNKFTSTGSAFSNFSNPNSSPWSNNASNQQNWRLVRAVILDGSIKLYKPPSDLGVKAFDIDTPLQPTPTSRQGPAGINHKRGMSNSPLVPKPSLASGSRLFYRGTEAHPELVYNDRGKIVGGSNEAICHAILFGSSAVFAKTSVLLLPIFTDIISAIDILTLYSTSVSHSGSTASTIPFSSANHNLSAIPTNTSKTESPTSHILVTRLQLVVETIQDNFPGMLLDHSIFSVFMRLVESVSYHDDAIATELKQSVSMKQKYMSEMLSYATHQDSVMWSSLQPNLPESTSERLHYILSRVETKSSSSNATPSQHYTNVNSTSPAPMVNTKLPSAISPDLILEFGVDTFAKQVFHFHLAFSKDWSPTSDISLLFNTKYDYNRHSPLVFDSTTNIHFLGALLVDHLLNPVHRIDNSYRGKTLTYWIKLGNALKNSGDMVGWLSIATVICSIPILRLRGTWCYVATEIRDRVIREWAPVVFDLERRLMVSDMSRKSTYHVLAPQGIGITYPKERVVPFFGDLCVSSQEGSSYKQCEGRLNSIQIAFGRWESYLDQIPQNDTFEPLPEAIPVIQKMLYALLSNHFEAPALTPDVILKMSLEIEPSLSGLYIRHHYQQRVSLASGSFLPIMFTKTVPSYSVFSPSDLISASGISAINLKRSLRPSSSRSGDAFRSSETSLHHASQSSSLSSLAPSVNTITPSGSVNSSRAILQTPPTDGYALTTGYPEVDSPSRLFVSKYGIDHPFNKSLHDVLNIGSKLYYISDDIVLKSFDNDIISLPSSVSGKLGQKDTAQVSGESHLSAGSDATVARIPPKVVNVVVKAATLERLIDILVLGVDDFGLFVTQSDKSPPNADLSIKIDMDVHTLTFFATYRSFCAPAFLSDSLRKRFLGARSAAVFINELRMKRDNASQIDAFPPTLPAAFPNWDVACDVDPVAIDWRTVAQIQIGVLEACHLWVSQYFGDFANDLTIRDQFLDFLRTIEIELQSWKESGVFLSHEYEVYYATIEALHKKVRKLFIKKSYRPIDVKRLVPTFAIGTKPENIPRNGDILPLEELIDKVDLVVAEYFNMISIKDWMELFEVLEVQNIQPAGFFNFRPPPSTNEDDAVVQDIFTYFETLFRDSPDDRVMFSFPRAVRELFRLHNNLVNYFAFQITDPSIKKDDRVGRMISILKMVGIIRQRMARISVFNAKDDKIPGDEHLELGFVPAFLEMALSAAILRPESRGFANSWLTASKEISRQFGGTFSNSVNSLDSMIPDISPSLLKKTNAEKAYTPCVGWLMERMLEIVCFIPNMSLENTRLVNFDKRRYIYNFVVNISDMKRYIDGLESLYVGGMDIAAVYTFTKRISYLINPAKGLYHLDRRVSRDAASRELKEFPKSTAKAKVFLNCLHSEMEKTKRDARQRESIDRHAKELKKASSKLKQPSAAPGVSGSMTSSERRSGKSRFGGFLKAVRPISMAFSSSFTPPTEKTLHPDDLPDFSSVGDTRFKLVASMNLVNASVAPLRSNREQSVFKIYSEGLQDLVLQAPSDASASEWIQTIRLAQKHAAMLAVMSPTSTKVFGVPVGIVCEREGLPFPHVVDVLLSEIEARGLDEVGLYRIPGSLASVNALKGAFDSGGEVNMEDDRWFDINTVTGCFKLYLRDLPEPLLTSELIGEFIICGSMGNTHDSTILLRRCVHRLPPLNYNLLKRVIDHLVLVTKHGKTNLMHAVNLAIVFSMSFLPAQSSASSVSSDLGAMQTMLKGMILERDELFNGIQDDDIDGPLPSQLPIMASSHHLGLLVAGNSTEPMQLPQAPQAPVSLIESESEGSVLSLEGLSRKNSETGNADDGNTDLSRDNIEQPYTLGVSSENQELSNVSSQFPLASLSAIAAFGEPSSDNGMFLSTPVPQPRKTPDGRPNKRFSSLIMPSDLVGSGIPIDDSLEIDVREDREEKAISPIIENESDEVDQPFMRQETDAPIPLGSDSNLPSDPEHVNKANNPSNTSEDNSS